MELQQQPTTEGERTPPFLRRKGGAAIKEKIEASLLDIETSILKGGEMTPKIKSEVKQNLKANITEAKAKITALAPGAERRQIRSELIAARWTLKAFTEKYDGCADNEEKGHRHKRRANKEGRSRKGDALFQTVKNTTLASIEPERKMKIEQDVEIQFAANEGAPQKVRQALQKARKDARAGYNQATTDEEKQSASDALISARLALEAFRAKVHASDNLMKRRHRHGRRGCDHSHGCHVGSETKPDEAVVAHLKSMEPDAAKLKKYISTTRTAMRSVLIEKRTSMQHIVAQGTSKSSEQFQDAKAAFVKARQDLSNFNQAVRSMRDTCQEAEVKEQAGPSPIGSGGDASQVARAHANELFGPIASMRASIQKCESPQEKQEVRGRVRKLVQDTRKWFASTIKSLEQKIATPSEGDDVQFFKQEMAIMKASLHHFNQLVKGKVPATAEQESGPASSSSKEEEEATTGTADGSLSAEDLYQPIASLQARLLAAETKEEKVALRQEMQEQIQLIRSSLNAVRLDTKTRFETLRREGTKKEDPSFIRARQEFFTARENLQAFNRCVKLNHQQLEQQRKDQKMKATEKPIEDDGATAVLARAQELYGPLEILRQRMNAVTEKELKAALRTDIQHHIQQIRKMLHAERVQAREALDSIQKVTPGSADPALVEARANLVLARKTLAAFNQLVKGSN